MNYMPGPGDSVTWGPVTSSADPRSQCWTFEFTAIIGMGCAEVEVSIEFYDDEPDGVIYLVDYQGVDITPTITDETDTSIRKQAKTAYMDYLSKGKE